MVIATISEAHIMYLGRGSTTVSQIVKMASRTDKYLSIKLTRFYMKVVGFWYAENQREQWILHAILAYTIVAVVFAISVEAVDLYYSWGDFTAVTYNVCITMPLIVIALKVTICILRRDVVLDLITFSEKHFWNATYDEFGEEVMRQCEKKGVVLLCILSCAVQGTVCSYVLVPLIENIGKNDTDRILPFRLWVDLPTKVTPYYEITFTIQTLSAIHSGICFFCFDNLMGILNIHVVGQFKMLQHKIENLCEEYISNMNIDIQFTANFNGDYGNHPRESVYPMSKMQRGLMKNELQEKLLDLGEKAYAGLKECIDQHLVLIDYVGKLEYVFNLMLLCQMGISSVFMCLAGFQFFVAKHGLFVLHLISAFSQMLLFTWTCNEIIVHSVEIGEAAFRARWYMMPNTGAGRSLRQGLILMMIRARRACYISAGKFTPMSLKSFTSILSTTLSYLSLLRQMSEEL